MMNPELKSVLVTGGAGYVGAHVILELLSVGYECIALDNLSNSCPESLKKVEQLTGKKVDFYNVNLLDKSAVDNVFSKHSFFAVIHCAGLKAVGESAEIPLMYYHNNVTGTIHLLECMDKYNCLNLVFSSSATVYGNPQYLPLDEKHPVGIGITNPYGKTKFFIEEIIKDLVATKKCWNTILLRYFNPIGAHKSGMIGEDPQGIPNNLMPYISQVAVGRRSHLNVFGNDYETVDGTGVRDYIHVVDLAIGHVAAVKKLEENCGYKLYNLGSGKGFSVLEMVKAMEGASGKQIACKFVDRRAGDLPSIYADASLAFNELQWKTERGLEEMCADTWNWQSQNPNGYLTCNDQAKK